MENPAQLQLQQWLVFLSAGIALGVLYDGCRAVRRCGGSAAQALADFVFVSTAGVSLFILAMLVGEGQLRIFMLGSAVLGAAGYSCLCSRFVVPLLCRGVRSIQKLVQFVRIPFRRVKKFLNRRKNIFPKRLSWSKINGYSFKLPQCLRRYAHGKRGATDAQSENRVDDGLRAHDDDRVRREQYYTGAQPLDPGRRLAGGADSADHSTSTGE